MLYVNEWQTNKYMTEIGLKNNIPTFIYSIDIDKRKDKEKKII